MNRAVEWEGFFNTRDLGGLPCRDGGQTAYGRVFRSATLRFVTDRGWLEAWTAGVRTIIDLRNDDEVHPCRDAPPSGSALFTGLGTVSQPPAEMARIRVPLDDVDDIELWQKIHSENLDGTPLYYPLFFVRKAGRCAAAVRAVARAHPGGVLFHCGAGRDRTGLVTLLLLSLAGVDNAAIATDYEQSASALPALFSAMGLPDQAPLVNQVLHAHGSTARSAVTDMLDGTDIETTLRDNGLRVDEIRAVRDRLLSSPPA